MHANLIPFGATGWAERCRLLDGLLSVQSGPPFLYADIVLIVPSTRLRRAYGRAVLDLVAQEGRAAAVSPPEVQTLDRFLLSLGERHVRRTLIDENSRLVLLEGIVKELLTGPAAGRIANVLAPSLSSAVAGMIEELSLAGVMPDRLAAAAAETGSDDLVQVRLLQAAYVRYLEVLKGKGLADPAGMLAALDEQFDPAWLAPYRTIVIDGIHDATELQVRILRKMAAAGSISFRIDAPSADLLRSSGEHHPLRLSRELIARLGLMVGEQEAVTDEEGLFLGGALFSDRPSEEFTQGAPVPFTRSIHLHSALNAREEVSHIAGMIKHSLRNGTPADAVLVSFPSLDEYGPLVEELFQDYGIPYNRALGRQLSTSSVVTSFLSLFQAVQDGFSGASLLKVFGAPFLKFADQPRLGPALDRVLRDRRITGGRERILSAARRAAPGTEDTDVVSGPLADLFSALEPFSAGADAPLSLWMERLGSLLRWSGIEARVERIKGPLNSNLQAHRSLSAMVASLGTAGALFPEYRLTFSEWLFLLRKTFMHARFQVPPDDEGGVQVLGLEESVAHAWSEIYLGGLVDGKFPRRLPQNIFLPEGTLETLGVRTLEKARLTASYHFYRLVLSAPRVVLSWPENDGDKPLVRSALLEELAPLDKAGVLQKRTHLQFSLEIGDAQSVPELARAIAFSGEAAGLGDVLASDQAGMAALRSAMTARPAPRQAPAPAKRTFHVTELDDYLRCPYDYFVAHVLGIRPLEEVSEDLTAQDRGTRVHAILRDFYRSWDRPITEENRGDAREVLAGLAERAYRSDTDTFRNRQEKALFLDVMAERFLDAEVLTWAQGFSPAYLEQRIEALPLALADGSDVELRAKIDRIDVDDAGNFIIVDYKTGGYPLPRMDAEQEIFQLPVYAVMARAALAGPGPALRRPVGLAYYDLSGKTAAQARDVVLFDREVRSDHPCSKQKSSPKSASEFEAILARSMDKARRAVESILRAEYPAAPADRQRCRFCPNGTICGSEVPE